MKARHYYNPVQQKSDEPNAINAIPYRTPGRLNAAQAAVVLGFEQRDIRVLRKAKMLKALGNPAPNAPKYFAACEIEEYANDIKWLGTATQVVYDYWNEKNARKTANVSNFGEDAEVTVVE